MLERDLIPNTWSTEYWVKVLGYLIKFYLFFNRFEHFPKYGVQGLGGENAIFKQQKTHNFAWKLCFPSESQPTQPSNFFPSFKRYLGSTKFL